MKRRSRSRTPRKVAAKRRPASKPKRADFIGFRCPGQEYEGRPLMEPRTCLSAQSGGVAYDDNAEWAEGEPEEMRLGHR